MSLVFHPMQGLRHHLEASHDFFDFGFSEDAPHALPAVSVEPCDYTCAPVSGERARSTIAAPSDAVAKAGFPSHVHPWPRKFSHISKGLCICMYHAGLSLLPSHPLHHVHVLIHPWPAAKPY